jgi:serine protease AprX
VCFSAGNAGADKNSDGLIDAQSISPPGTAKNCITVGACENERPDKTLTYGQGWHTSFRASPIASDRVADNPDGIVAFSSRGPTRDQRIKPDVVAPGSYILSTRSRATTSEGWELSDDPLYMFEGGTSMATPLVAGCVALVREYLAKKQGKTNPGAALVKAMLINGAQDISGQYVPSEAGATPNNAEGFGRVDMRATVDPLASGARLVLKDEDVALDTGEEKKTTVTVDAGTKCSRQRWCGSTRRATRCKTTSTSS